jgi:TolA-binding protein
VPRAGDSAATLLGVARAKYETRLYDQALSDLRTITTTHTASPSAPTAYLLIGQIHEQQSRPDDAMAAYVELRSRYAGSDAGAEASYRLAQLIQRTRRPDRVKAARDLLAEIPGKHAKSPWAPRALAARAALETREKIKEPDAVLGATVPAAIATNRVLAERYPAAPEAEAALWQLGEAYDDLKRYDLAARAFQDLATRFPRTRYDAWWRAGEILDKRVKDKNAAGTAYARVPERSPNYREAQKRSR